MSSLHGNYKILPFESDAFQAPVWQLKNALVANAIVELSKAEDVALISYRDDAVSFDVEKVNSLKNAGFYEVETLTTLEKQIENLNYISEWVHIANTSDAEVCAQIASICFKNDRYHSDENIDDVIADLIKSRWVFNSVSGRADKVFVYRNKEQQILGFNACMFNDEVAIIDLIGVHPDYQGQGIGRDLIGAMEHYYSGKARSIRLGTQLSNESSQEFYKSLGFTEISRQITWHWINRCRF